MQVVKEKLQTLLQFWEEIHECLFVFKYLCLNTAVIEVFMIRKHQIEHALCCVGCQGTDLGIVRRGDVSSVSN